MSSLNEIKAVIKKISEIGDLGQHMCFFGGSVPYIYYNKECFFIFLKLIFSSLFM